MLGRETMMPIELVYPSIEPEPQDSADYVERLSKSLGTAYSRARGKLGMTGKIMTRNYVLKLNKISYKVGNPMLFLDTTLRKGVSKSPKWTGPCFLFIKYQTSCSK